MESCKSQLTSQDSEWRFQWDFNLLIHISVDIKQDSFAFRTKFVSNISISPKNNQQKFWKFFRLATLTNWPLDKPVAGRLTLQTITTHKHSSVPQINLIFFCTRRTSSLRRKLSITLNVVRIELCNTRFHWQYPASNALYADIWQLHLPATRP